MITLFRFIVKYAEYADWLIIGLYFVVVVGLGFWYRRRAAQEPRRSPPREELCRLTV